MARKVRTPDGAKRFGQPIGSVISNDRVGRSAKKVLGRLDGGDSSTSSKPPTPAAGPKGKVVTSTPPKPAAQPTPDVRVPVGAYGMKYSGTSAKTVERARTLTPDHWKNVPVEKINPSTSKIVANEETLKRKHIDRVVGGEPLREGYINQMYRDDDGSLHVVDGHHRVAMYSALKRDDMPVQIVDKATVDRLLGGTSSEAPEAAEKLSTARPKKVRAQKYDPAHPTRKTHEHPNILPRELERINNSTASANRRRLRAFDRDPSKSVLTRFDKDLQPKIDYIRARVAETESPAQRKKQEDVDAAFWADVKAKAEQGAREQAKINAEMAKRREEKYQSRRAAQQRAADLARDGFYSKTASKTRIQSKITEYEEALKGIEGNDNVYALDDKERLEEKLFKAKEDLRLHASRRRAKARRRARNTTQD